MSSCAQLGTGTWPKHLMPVPWCYPLPRKSGQGVLKLWVIGSLGGSSDLGIWNYSQLRQPVCPQETFAKVWRHSGCHHGEYDWHLVRRGQGCCSTLYSAQEGPRRAKTYPAPNVYSDEVETPCSSPYLPCSFGGPQFDDICSSKCRSKIIACEFIPVEIVITFKTKVLNPFDLAFIIE